ncbi:MAG TPA: trypsin-like peptidase domain-containing protein [Syntrophomonas sp.]|nr:trypsin-like peptidase domain-containing protein [Syntrophomonas sp.]
MKKWYAKLFAVLLVGFMIGGAVVAQGAGISLPELLHNNNAGVVAAATDTVAPGSTVTVTGAPLGVADIVEKAGPAVVNVEAKVKVSSSQNQMFNDPFFRQFFGQDFQVVPQDRYETGIGTGFLITQDGYIITNQHVVNNAESVSITMTGKKDKIPATVVGQDYELDLAVLKISGSNYPTLPMGDSDKMRVGDGVIAIGEPYGLDHTVTTGVVSAKGRPITIEDRNYKNLIQTDAAINPGNSGGPLLNLQGEVIAINTAVNASAQGIGFAIPINTAQGVLQQLMKGEKVIRPYMGIRMTDVTDEVIQQLQLSAGTKGALVLEAVSGSPAAKAGIAYLDIIQKIDSEVMQSADDVQKAIEGKKVGQTISVQLLRQGKSMTLSVVLQAKP